jgi:RND family efflux transporter MFP subunit
MHRARLAPAAILLALLTGTAPPVRAEPPRAAAAGAAPARAALDAGEAAAMPVRIVRPEPAAAGRTLVLPGATAAIEEAVIFARVNGYVRERLVDIGDRVAAGQLLAVIDAPELDFAHERARAEVRQAEASLRLARVNVERAATLVAQGHVSQQVLDERSAELGIRQADLDAAAAEVRRLAQLISFRRITAPFAGTVADRNTDKGDLVEADTPDPDRFLFRLVRLDTLRIHVSVPQSDIRGVGVGTPAEIRFAEFPERVLRGDVVRVAGALDAASRTMRIEVKLPNPDGLPAGMLGEVTFRLGGDQPPPLTLPVNAVVTRSTGPVVAVVDGDRRVRFQAVRLGRNLGARIEILDGIAADADVVVNPNSLLKDGDPVRREG